MSARETARRTGRQLGRVSGAGELRRLRAEVARLRDDVAENRELDRLLGDQVAELEASLVPLLEARVRTADTEADG